MSGAARSDFESGARRGGVRRKGRKGKARRRRRFLFFSISLLHKQHARGPRGDGPRASRNPAPRAASEQHERRVQEKNPPQAEVFFVCFAASHFRATKTSANSEWAPRRRAPAPATPRDPRWGPAGPPRLPQSSAGPPGRAPPGHPRPEEQEQQEDKGDDVCLPRSSQRVHDFKWIRVSGNPSLRH